MNSEQSRILGKLSAILIVSAIFLTNASTFSTASAAYDPRTDSSVFFRVKEPEMRIALSFDDGPLNGKTDKILDILDRYNVKATFFMVGSQAEYCGETARRVVSEGHEVGNHTFNHKNLATMSPKELDCEIASAEEAIFNACGYIPSLFRPPEGVCTEKIANAAKYRGYSIVMWSVDTLDWQGKSANEIANNVISNVTPGAVVLMHDGIFAKSHTAEALEIIIPALMNEGYEFVTVGELIANSCE